MITREFPQLLDVGMLERGANAAKAVARLDLEHTDGTLGHGTAFLIAADLVLTAYQNLFDLDSIRDLRKVTLRFDYAAGSDGSPLASIERVGHIDSIVGSAAANWAAIRLDQALPSRFPSLTLDPAVPTRVGTSAFIIQHPHAELKKVALGIRAITHVDDFWVRYLADTMPGSSGAPVFNEAWQVIAIHLASNNKERVNEGVRIEPILRELRGGGVIAPKPSGVPESLATEESSQNARPRSRDPRPQIYLCACVADQRISEKLETYLAPLVRAGKTVIWHRGKVPPGTDVVDVSARELRRAHMVLVLLSADYFESSEAVKEGEAAIAFSKTHGTKVIPILARPSMWEMTPFGGLQVLPRDGQPLIRAMEAEETFVTVARAVGAILMEDEF